MLEKKNWSLVLISWDIINLYCILLRQLLFDRVILMAHSIYAGYYIPFSFFDILRLLTPLLIDNTAYSIITFVISTIFQIMMYIVITLYISILHF